MNSAVSAQIQAEIWKHYGFAEAEIASLVAEVEVRASGCHRRFTVRADGAGMGEEEAMAHARRLALREAVELWAFWGGMA